ncbi:universal stress protein [Pseudomonas sp. GD03842]|uniref:universal stress protein n=1 Tax=unclassified Pseudomonas TaxID=196821 RepID=UPI002113A831|nr:MULTISPECIES: universal stress protein [unclassified Pseudomonas]MDH0747182.1 universal stress protein [Pseudomonas sp. GD03842]
MSAAERLMLIAPSSSRKTSAFDRAAALAQAMDVPLHIVAFGQSDGLATASLVNESVLALLRQAWLDRQHQWLENEARSIRASGVTVTTEFVWANQLLNEILTHIRELNPSMVIKDLEHQSWLTRAIFTSLDLRLLADCPTPLHLVAEVTHPKPQKILAAVDPFRPHEQFDDINGAIIRAAEQLAAQCEAELHMLYAYDLSYAFASQGYKGFSSSLAETLYAEQEQAMEQLAQRFGVPWERRHLMTGRPARCIEDFAQAEGIDVVVMGTVHRDDVTRLLGSTTEQVAAHMRCSVLTVNPRQQGA